LPENVTINGQERNLEKLLVDLDTTGLVILKDGVIIHESYGKGTAQTDLRISWSVAKSFMSGLYGNAVASGAIKSLDDKVEDYAPSLKGSAYEGATIRNVLNMASGITFNEDYMDPKSDINDMGRILGLGGSMDDYAAGLTAKDVPAGERWKYVSIDTHVAAMVRATAMWVTAINGGYLCRKRAPTRATTPPLAFTGNMFMSIPRAASSLPKTRPTENSPIPKMAMVIP